VTQSAHAVQSCTYGWRWYRSLDARSRNACRPLLVTFAKLLRPGGVRAVTPYAIDIPLWFANTFLDLREDIAEATRNGQRLLVYSGQDGCPYCKQLMVTNFSQRSIVEKTRQHFVALAVNMWGDREVTWLDGRVMTEKELARVLKVQFTPTLLFFAKKEKVVVRLNGYYLLAAQLPGQVQKVAGLDVESVRRLVVGKIVPVHVATAIPGSARTHHVEAVGRHHQ
jgi:thiol-disulfide isomerase/thioredoxin